MEKYLIGLNNEQKQAILDTEGYVLVFAGAGSGKTRVLTTRIAYLVKELGVYPENILAITFTNKAADEMRERLSNMIDGVSNMWVSTIHSMCVRILRSSIGRLEGYNKNFSIYSEVDKTNVLKRIIKELNLDQDKYLKKAIFYISDCKNQDIGPSQFKLRTDIKDIGVFAQLFTLYEEELHKSNALDFDDLLVKTYHLLESDSEVLEYYANKFQYIHIDEFQDTNAIQMEIASLLCSVHKNLFVVGDDDQSIYSWRGAEIKNILEFEKNFTGAKIHKLEQNYRSTKKILDLANTIIASNSERKQKKLWTENEDGEKIEVKIAENENEEAQYTAFKIKQLMASGAKASDFAVLMRINALSRAYEQEFAKYNIPFKVYGGFKFFERKEIKDITAYMRLIVNPLDNESLLRIINTPKRGIGDKTVETLKNYAHEYDLSIFDGIVDCDRLDLSSGAKKKLDDFRKLISSLMVECAQKPLTEIFDTVIEKTAFMMQFEAKSEENYSKQMNVNEYQNSIEEFAKLNPNASLADFLNSITLSSDTDEIEEGNYVSVATIHSVKGLEFPYVFICGLDETILPISRATESDSEMQEERRLMYVAITRAQKKLYLTRASSRFLYGNRQFTAQSSFLNELAPKLGIAKPRVNSFDFYQRRERNSYSNDYDRGYGADQDSAPSSTLNFSSNVRNFSAKPKQINSEVAGYKTGKKVQHAKFGTGTVIMVKGEGKNLVVDVAFPGVGIKSLAVAYAPLKLLD
ncbi:MAG: UvrD-helicase domain-containing protein [Clostridia bacterium]|nr:UvrD-helicase domain-containing protein [Clostridia bacterium]